MTVRGRISLSEKRERTCLSSGERVGEGRKRMEVRKNRKEGGSLNKVWVKMY